MICYMEYFVRRLTVLSEDELSRLYLQWRFHFVGHTIWFQLSVGCTAFLGLQAPCPRSLSYFFFCPLVNVFNQIS